MFSTNELDIVYVFYILSLEPYGLGCLQEDPTEDVFL